MADEQKNWDNSDKQPHGYANKHSIFSDPTGFDINSPDIIDANIISDDVSAADSATSNAVNLSNTSTGANAADSKQIHTDSAGAGESIEDILNAYKIENIDDALNIIDNSDHPPAPSSERPIMSISRTHGSYYEQVDYTSAKAKKTDKYGLPITTSKAKPTETIQSKQFQGKDTDIVKRPQSSKLTALLKKNEPDVSMPNFEESGIDKGPPDFKMKFDFESAYRDPPERRPLRRRRERRTGLIGGVMFAVFILCISLVLASVMWMATLDVLGFGFEDEFVDVIVPSDFTMSGISDMLYESGLIRYKALFSIYSDYSSAEEKIAPGEYILNKSYDYRAIVQGMTARAGIRVETTVVIPEGFTLSQIFNLLDSEGVCSVDKLWDAAANHDFDFYFLDKETLGDRLRLEGFLFPDTYNFYKDSTPVQAITKMLREFDRKFTEQYIERAGMLGYTVSEVIIIASMIEREAGDDEERPRIAAVIYNRLNNPDFPFLEIDATIHYARTPTGAPFSTDYDSVYNTYIYPGLPPGAIANPGLASIRAALYPSSTNEYFYALNKYGTHTFFTNIKDHQNFVNSDEYGG